MQIWNVRWIVSSVSYWVGTVYKCTSYSPSYNLSDFELVKWELLFTHVIKSLWIIQSCGSSTIVNIALYTFLYGHYFKHSTPLLSSPTTFLLIFSVDCVTKWLVHSWILFQNSDRKCEKILVEITQLHKVVYYLRIQIVVLLLVESLVESASSGSLDV